MREQIGPYTVERALGRGGMGVVYAGVHHSLNRRVAIKALAPELTRDPAFRERFFSEARTQAQLQHSNIVTIYDLLEDDEEFFIVMEYVEGRGLDEMLDALAGHGMPLAQALAIFHQVLAALAAAHVAGVIHRDVKPSNVLITDQGTVKLMDFGIALLVGDLRLTASSQTIGTPVYMSPEQILRPRDVDHRTDLYSAAVMLYEMLAGRPPFDGETEFAVKKLHI
ncbi:MAG: serine/threonine-protein kinase, partial [Acidobacteriota bacterium]